jgi:hypothetical protein
MSEFARRLSEAHMGIKQLLLTASVLAASIPGLAVADDMQRQYVQEAEIEIEPAQLDDYKAAVTEQIETAIRVEPGVLVLHAVSEKDNPTRASGCSKFTGMWMRTGRISQPCISKNTRQRQRKW